MTVKSNLSRSQRMKFRYEEFLKNPYCFHCGNRMILNPEPEEVEDMATIEHLIQPLLGGSDFPDNLRLVHKKCNK